MPSSRVKDIRPPTNETTTSSLSQQYGGKHAGGWVDRLPISWTPYIQLARLSPPVAIILIYFPLFFGVIHAAATIPKQPSIFHILYICGVLLGSTIFASNAVHAWNDLIDAPIDKEIARTMNRPIPRGDVSPRAAILFALSQSIGTALFLSLLPIYAIWSAMPAILTGIYYPWAKRHTQFPQVVLGFSMSWRTMVGSASMGVERPWEDVSTVALLLACILWVVIYDSIYSYQDIADDVRVGVKSIPVLFRDHTKWLLWTLLIVMEISLAYCGLYAGMGIHFYAVTVGGCFLSLGVMLYNVALGDPASCWRWFSSGFWLTGTSISLGLIGQYVLARIV